MQTNLVDWNTRREKLDVLRQRSIYPDHPASVNSIETHLSLVLLTDRFAYKLRKSVRYGALDLTTLECRFEDAQREVRWNQRLAKGVYFGVVPLTYSAVKGFKVEGQGEVVDWLVKMRRLPAVHILTHKIRVGTLSDDDIYRLARHLAMFYVFHATVLADGPAYIKHVKKETEISYMDLATSELDLTMIATIKDCLFRYIRTEEALFLQRVSENRVVDGHGDLRPEHVCIEPNREPVIFDCLQYDSELRISDALDEFSFLGMECGRIGKPEIEEKLISKYRNLTHDTAPEHLRCFYKAYRAYMWARLAIWRTRESKQGDWTKWMNRAREYLMLAEKHCRALTKKPAPRYL